MNKTMRRFCLVLISAVIVLTFMTIDSFAAEKLPVKGVFAGSFDVYPGESPTTEELIQRMEKDYNTIQAYFEDKEYEIEPEGIKDVYIYGTKTYKDEHGQDITESAFFLENADPSDPRSKAHILDVEFKTPMVIGSNILKIKLGIPHINDEGELEFLEFIDEFNTVIYVDKPTKVEFKPAAGFAAEGAIGFNCIEERNFYGEGNAFEVTYERISDEKGNDKMTYTTEYKYVKAKDQYGDTVEGFYDSGDVRYKRFELDADGYYCDLKKGKNKVELTYYEYVDWQEDPIAVPFEVEINASKYEVYCVWKVYDYTGKVIKPKFVVRRMYDDKVVPASQYTYTAPKNKKMGYYDVQLKFKDAYKNTYMQPTVVGSYGIGPKTPKITKVKGAKKSLKVNWKKFTKKQLKTVDVMYIEVSTDKYFYNNYKRFTVKGKALKKGTKTLKKLKAKKKYYVRMYTVKKKVKQGSYTFSMMSNDSNIKSAKTKK